MDVGLELRLTRERQGISLQHLSNVTKISPRVLQAIEAAEEVHLPAPVFTRAFVKSYAREVGLDPAEMASRYLAQFDPPEEVQPTTEAPPAFSAFSVWGQRSWAAFNQL